jgi:rhomboid protease GluP
VLVLVHLLSGAWMYSQGDVTALEAWVLGRGVPFRVEVGGQYWSLVQGGEWWRLCTSVLLHADLLHLGVNAMALLALGRLLEPWVGPVRWLAWFFIGGVTGSMTSHALGLLQSDGASGGAFALLGATMVLGWRVRGALSDEDRRLYGPILWAFTVGNLVLSLALPFVDAAGHTGGLLAGLVLGWLPDTPAVRWVEAGLCGAFLVVCAAGWAGP